MSDQPAIPSSKAALAAIDLGAESCRVSLLRFTDGTPKMQLVYRFANHAVESVDGLHWNLDSILTGLDEGLKRCAAIASEGIRSLAVDGWAVDYVRLNASGEPIAPPFCYRDERTVVAEAALHERLSAERMRELTGIQLLRLNTAYQMFADTAELRGLPWLNLPEFILYRLGARPVSERTNASHTQMLGLDNQWCNEILKELDITAANVPELVEPGTDIGQLNGKLAEFPAFRATRLIAPACHDTASAIAAIPDAGDDWAYISSGTWSLVGTLLTSANNSPRACAENFTNLAGAAKTVCFHKNVNGMWLLRQCIESWQGEGAKTDLPTLVQQASHVAPLAYTLDVDDPDLLLSGRMPQRINAQLHRRGLPELSVHASDAPAMASFIFHSLAARYAEVLRSVAEITGKCFTKLYIMGGGSQNQFLNKLTAEATGLEVCRVGSECSTVGNFAVQLAALEPEHTVSEWARALESVH
jgi:rhamnulokinase